MWIDPPIYSSATPIVAEAIRAIDGASVILEYPAAEHPNLVEIARYRLEHELLKVCANAPVVRAIGLEQVDDRYVLIRDRIDAITLHEHARATAIAGDLV